MVLFALYRILFEIFIAVILTAQSVTHSIAERGLFLMAFATGRGYVSVLNDVWKAIAN